MAQGSGQRQLGISVAVAVVAGILVSRALEPHWGPWGFVAAMAAAALLVVGISVLWGKR
ncbi:MAG: hypothetical protein RBU30_25705 [Polyangia bacterium]|nr:hypothetical protein [Polyangia bacterium]